MFLTLFGSAQSVSLQCIYYNADWGVLGKIYFCNVQNTLNITSLDAAQVDNITGTHLAGFNNDNVEAISITQGQIIYFPRGLNKIYKNLKGISIVSNGFKEIHQSDLKDFPKLMNLYLYSKNIEILEENLFEFNPNLELVHINTNIITHIDPKVFDRLIKLKYLYLQLNTCINMAAINNPTDLQSIIKIAKLNCTNLDYSNLEQKVKYLEFESRILSSTDLNIKIENLKNEIKNSKFPNFFQEKLQGLNAVAIQKERENVVDSKLTIIEEMLANMTAGNGICNKNNIVLNIS